MTKLTPEQRADRSMSEREVKRSVVGLAEEAGWKVYTVPQDKLKRPEKRSAGYPDITLAREGEARWIECKDQQRALEPAQVEWAHHIGSRWYVARPSDLRLGLVAEWLR